jgi:hypothetical protein
MTEVLENAALFGIRKGDIYQLDMPLVGVTVPARVEGFILSTIDPKKITKEYLTPEDLEPRVEVELRELEAPHYMQVFSVESVLNGATGDAKNATRISLITDAEKEGSHGS